MNSMKNVSDTATLYSGPLSGPGLGPKLVPAYLHAMISSVASKYFQCDSQASRQVGDLTYFWVRRVAHGELVDRKPRVCVSKSRKLAPEEL